MDYTRVKINKLIFLITIKFKYFKKKIDEFTYLFIKLDGVPIKLVKKL